MNMSMVWQNLIVYGIVAMAFGGLMVYYWRKNAKRGKGKGCGNDCGCGVKKRLKEAIKDNENI